MMVGGPSQYGGHPHPLGDPAEISYLQDRQRHHSMLDSIERRTQRTYRYGIMLVCVGATLNWLGFAQVRLGGNSYIDPLRYLGVACVISGSFCVCLAMCRWLGRPISLSGHRLEEESLGSRSSGDVHVINVAVPMYVPSMSEEYRPTKPPDYEIVTGEPQPPPYDEAIKLSPGTLISLPSPSHSTHSSTPLLEDSKVSISSELYPGSPPPPYHPSPSRLVSNNINSHCSSANKPLYHMSAEQEQLLGLMMRGQRSEDVSQLPPLMLINSSSIPCDTLINNGNLLSTTNFSATDGNGNVNSSSVILNMETPPTNLC